MKKSMVKGSFMGGNCACYFKTTCVVTRIFQQTSGYYPWKIMNYSDYSKSNIIDVLFSYGIHWFDWPTKIHESIKIT